MGSSRQEYWSGLPFPPPWDLPSPGIEPVSLTSPALAGGFFTTSASWEAPLKQRELKKKKFCIETFTKSVQFSSLSKKDIKKTGACSCGL